MNAAHTIEKKNVPLVIDGEAFPGSGIPLYFLDGVEDLPLRGPEGIYRRAQHVVR